VPPSYEVTIRRTTDGVPHITGRSLSDLAYGQGYVSAEDYGCTLLDQILKVFGVRSAALGPGANGENVESDFAWRAIGLTDIAATDFAEAPAEVVEQFDAFAIGWNQFLADAGDTGLTGFCSGAEWVRPIEPVEVYTYARSVALLASGARVLDFIPSAQPPTGEENGESGFVRSSTPDPTLDAAFDRLVLDDVGVQDLGSNAWAIGRDRTEAGAGAILAANPHFPWEGELRFVETHLVVPDEIDIYGAQLAGLPGIGIGFTDGVAWSHTVSAGKRFTAYELTLDPESPTTYLVDGEPRQMTPTEHTVEILRADGSVDTEKRTLWESEYGPILDFPGIGWTESSVITYRDANIDNDEFVEFYADMIDVTDLDDLIETHERHQAVPLFNTVAAGADGRTWYADTAATPNLSAEAELAFLSALFAQEPVASAAYDNGVILLDGSDSRFRWEEVPGSRDPGLVPFDEMPQVERTDHVFNANDSFWVPSAEFTLTGDFSIAHGEQRTPLSMRTRQNAAVLAAADPLGLAGDDGAFSGDEVRTAVFDNSAHTAVLLREQIVAACRTTSVVEVGDVLADDGTVLVPAGPVDISLACSVLDAWDGRYDLDSAGPLLWREVMNRFTEDERRNTGRLFGDAFSVDQPTTTPSVLAADVAPILEALATAVQTLTSADFDLDSPLGAAQFTERSGTRIPLHGGTNTDGTTNIVSWSDTNSSSEESPTRGDAVLPGASLRGDGHPVNFGTSFVMVVDFTSGTPEATAILTYGQTSDRDSPLFESQTVRFSEKRWRPIARTDDEIAADPELTEITIRQS
jgi:acyl-homoserine-lactone acylase